MLPDKFETKVVENSGIQKQFRIIKKFDKENEFGYQLRGCRTRRRTDSALGHE
jgi:hypothetical protein